MNNVKIFQMKIVIFRAVKNRYMLHGRVFVMKKYVWSVDMLCSRIFVYYCFSETYILILVFWY